MTGRRGADEAGAGLVHKLAGEQALARGHRLLDPLALEAAAAGVGVDSDRFLAAILALAGARVVNVHTFGPSSLITLLRLTEDGFVRHLTATRSDLDAVRGRVLDALRAQAGGSGLGQAVDLAGALGEPTLLVEVLLDELRGQGRLVFTNVAGGRFRIHRMG
ncbi:MAG: hypothetical protein ACR2MO_16595 [Acidimicrobiales bacterium]